MIMAKSYAHSRGDTMGNCTFKRDAHTNNYTCLNNSILHDDRLSWKAKSFLWLLLSLPDNWNFSYAGLSKLTGLSISTIKRLMDELRKCRYVEILKQNPTSSNNKYGYQYIIHEISECE